MKIPYVRVKVTRDPMMIVDTKLLATEVPCLMAVHGVAKVAAGAPLTDPAPVQTDAQTEYSRLARRFGQLAGTEQLVVERAYGQAHERGLRAFISNLRAGVAVGAGGAVEEEEDPDDDEDELELEAALESEDGEGEAADDGVEQLRARLDELGVEYDGRWRAPRLRRAVEEAEAAIS